MTIIEKNAFFFVFKDTFYYLHHLIMWYFYLLLMVLFLLLFYAVPVLLCLSVFLFALNILTYCQKINLYFSFTVPSFISLKLIYVFQLFSPKLVSFVKKNFSSVFHFSSRPILAIWNVFPCQLPRIEFLTERILIDYLIS